MKIFVITLMFLLASTFSNQGKQKNISQEQPDYSFQSPGTLRDSVEMEIYKYTFKYPDIVIAQALFEAGSKLNSPVARDNNNIFGMRKASSRLSISKTTNRNYAYYEHWKESIVDRALYEASYLRNKSREEYFNYLGRNYSTSGNYASELKKIVKGLK